VNPQDGRRFLRNSRFYAGGIEIMRRRINIRKNGCQPFPLQGMGRGDKRKSRQDHLARQLKRVAGNLKPDRRITNGDAMLDPKILAELRLELLNQLAIVREPAPLEHLVDEPIEQIAITNVRTTDMELLPSVIKERFYRFLDLALGCIVLSISVFLTKLGLKYPHDDNVVILPFEVKVFS